MCILTEHGQLCGPVHHIPFALSGRLSSRTEWKAEFKDRKTPNWDTRHWMSNFGSMLAAPKGTPTHNLFATLLSDALFTILPGEYHRVKHYLLSQRNLSSDEIKKMKRSFWRRHCRYACQEPKVLLPRIYFMYQFFCAINNPHHENGKVLVGNHRDIFYKEIKHVQHGLFSDPEGMIMYAEVPRSSKTGRKGNLMLTKYRSLRTTSPLEASFLHLHSLFIHVQRPWVCALCMSGSVSGTGHGIHERYRNLGKDQTCITHGCGWWISWLMCVQSQICFHPDLLFQFLCVAGHGPRPIASPAPSEV